MQLFFFTIFSAKILGIIIGAYHFKQLSFPFRILYFQVCIALVIEIIGAYIALVLREHNIWLFNTYLLFETGLVLTPAILLLNNPKLKKAAWALLATSPLAWIVNVYHTGIHSIANWHFLTYCIIAIITYLFLLFDSGIFNGKKLRQQPVFWIALSALVYFACMIPYKGFETYLFANDMKMARTLFNINAGLGFLRYLFLAISFYILGNEAKKNIINDAHAY